MPDRIAAPLQRLKQLSVFVSAFIDPDEKQIVAAAKQGFDAVELHTGDYANANGATGASGSWIACAARRELAASHGLRLARGARAELSERSARWPRSPGWRN